MTEETANAAPEPRNGRRWPKLLLAASLTLNVLVLSVVAGAHVRDDRDRRMSPMPDRTVLREGGFMPFFDAMPREARKRMSDAFRASEHGKAPDRAVLAADFRDFLSALRQEPFDAATVDGLLMAQQDRAAARVAAGRGVLVDQIAGMSPAERAAFADALEDRFQDALNRVSGRPEGGRGPNH